MVSSFTCISRTTGSTINHIFMPGIKGMKPFLLFLTVKLLEGNIPNSKMRLVQAWIELHKDELVANWELTVSGEQP
jgi:hypothetical protein